MASKKMVRPKDDNVEVASGMIMIPGHTSRSVGYADTSDGVTRFVTVHNCASPKIYISVVG